MVLAHRIEQDGPDAVSVAFEARCRRSPFMVRRTLSLTGETNTLDIHEMIVNEGGVELEFMWGHHPVFGTPFLAPGTRLSLPGGRVAPVGVVDGLVRPKKEPTEWPIYCQPNGRQADLRVLPEPGREHVGELYVSDMPTGSYTLTNLEMAVGFRLRWETAVFPYLWMWRFLGPTPRYPWYGRAYLVGLEPFSSVPPQTRRQKVVPE
jgi:Domain of unknown function (DUF4432)